MGTRTGYASWKRQGTEQLQSEELWDFVLKTREAGAWLRVGRVRWLCTADVMVLVARPGDVGSATSSVILELIREVHRIGGGTLPVGDDGYEVRLSEGRMIEGRMIVMMRLKDMDAAREYLLEMPE